MARTIIAISGWAKSGKDTMASLLIEKGATRIAFADPLKSNVVRDHEDVTLKMVYEQSLKEKPILSMPVDPEDEFSRMIARFMVKEFRSKDGKTPDDYVYFAGTEDSEKSFMGMMEDGTYDKLYWTPRALCILEGSVKRTSDSNYWVKKAIQKADENGVFVISDLRYKSELYGIKMSINPEDTLITVRVNRFKTTNSNDPSERDLDNAEFDYVIENTGSLQDYISKINSILKERGV